MGYYIKKTEQTAPVQAVTESSLKSASEINVPTVKAVLDGLHYPNLLINGDFQCNQRERSSYAINGAYSLDMWLIKQGLKVDIISNGIRITQRDDGAIFLLQQFIQSEMFNNQSYTLNIKCSGKVTSATFVYNDTNYTSSLDAPFIFENAVIGIKVFNHNGKKVFQIYLKVRTSDIEHINLFNGDIAYPHVKEDYAIALMKCQNKVIFYDNIYSDSNITASHKAKNDLLIYNIWLPCDLSGATVAIGEAAAYAGGTTNSYTIKLYSAEVLKNRVRLRFKKTDENSFPIESDTEYNISIRNLLITKEPL